MWESIFALLEQETDPDEAVRRAQARTDWRESPEGKRFPKLAAGVFVAFLIVGAAAGLAIGWLNNLSTYDPYARYEADEAFVYAVSGIVISLLPAFFAIFLMRVALGRRFLDRKILRDSLGALEEAEANLSETDTETAFVSLWQVTQKRLDYYHQIATSQSRQSFLYGQVAAAIGLAIVLLCALIAAFANSTAGSVTTGLLGVTGAGLAGYIGATFMRSQDTASQQLRAYFAQPLEFSRFLAAERLLPSITDVEAREAATAQLISVIAASVRPPGDPAA